MAHANIMHAALASDTACSERSRMEINFGHSLCNPTLLIQIESSPPIHPSESERAPLLSPAGTGWLRLTDGEKKNHTEYRMTGESGRCALFTPTLKCAKAVSQTQTVSCDVNLQMEYNIYTVCQIIFSLVANVWLIYNFK